jgi:hypothetical protein
MRALVLSFSNLTPIPDGSLLYSCRLSIAADASLGPHALPCSGPDASSPDGEQIAIACPDGEVDVISDGGGSGR